MNKKLHLLVWLVLALLCQGARAQNFGPLNAQDFDAFVGNFDGVGAGDVLYVPKDPARPVLMSTGNFGGHSWPTNHLGISWSTAGYNFIPADFNGDGRTDLLLQRKTPGDHYVLLSAATANFPGINQTIAATTFGLVWSADEHNLVAGDFNGDGKADLFFQAKTTAGTSAILFSDSGGGLFTASSSTCYANGPHRCWTDSGSLYQGLKWSEQSATVYAGRFNNDTKTDLLVIAKPKIVLIDYDVAIPVPSYPPQMNGIVLSQSTGMTATFSVGQYFSRKSFGVDWAASVANVIVGDFDHNGVDDVLLQVLRTGNLSYWVPGATNGTFGTGAALTTSYNWAADHVRLLNVDTIVGSTVVPRGGVFAQQVAPNGLNEIIDFVTSGSPTITADVGGTLGTTYPVTDAGRTPGTASVSRRGEANYSIPIDLPSGVNGLTPQLGIVYRHNSGIGLLGPKWDLTGLSSISRCRPTFAQDGTTGPLLMAAADQYCIDGNRLRLVAGLQGQAGSEYRMELERFEKITVETATSAGPTWFKVRGKDGLTYEYGNSTQSVAKVTVGGNQIIRTWLLNKVTDRSNNEMTYEYALPSDGSAYISSIKYGGVGAGTPAYTVQFTTGDYPDGGQALGFEWFAQVMMSRRILQIKLLDAVGTDVRSYNFEYHSDGNGPPSRSILGSVQQCAQNTSRCLPLTGFLWTQGKTGLGSNEISIAAPTNPDAVIPLDMNGDGYNDLVYFGGGVQWKVLWGSAAGVTGPTTINHNMGPFPSISAAFARAVDVDSDGRTDLLVPNGSNWWWVRYNASGVFEFADLGVSGGMNSTIADVDGDGYQDIVSQAASGTALEIRYHRRDGLAGYESTVTTVSFGGASVGNLTGNQRETVTHRTIDVNGDGRDDVIAVVGSTNRILYSSGTGFTLGDPLPQGSVPIHANADPCTDFIGPTSPRVLYTSKCHVVSGVGLNTSVTTPLSGNFVKTADWDGDGYEDVLYQSASTWYVGYSTGVNLEAGVATTTSTSVSNVTYTYLPDMDGNGRPDMVYVDNTATWRFHRNIGGVRELVSSITDGFGNKTTFNYGLMAPGSCYTQDTAAPGANTFYRQMNGMLYVACSMVASDGIGGNYTLTYTYEHAKRHLQGRGFMGFDRRTVVDHRTNVTTREDYSQTFPYIGMPLAMLATQSSGAKIREVTNTLATKALGSGGSSRHFPYIGTAVVDTYEVDPSGLPGSRNGAPITKQTTTTVVDDYGNPTSVTVDTQDKDALSTQLDTIYRRVSTATYNNNTANWCVALPHERTLSETMGGITRVHTTASTVDYVACRVTQDVIEPSIPALKVTTDYEYLPVGCGNVTAITVTGNTTAGAALASRTTHYDYGTKCRLPEMITDAANQVTRVNYRYDLGLPTWIKDPNWSNEPDATALRTSFAYDPFGRQTQETRTDGTSTTISYGACNVANFYCGNPAYRMRVDTSELPVGGGTPIRTTTAFLDSFERYRLGTTPLTTGGSSYINMTYDVLGRVKTRSEPYTTAGTGYTEYDYDILGRQIRARLRDSADVVLRDSRIVFGGRKMTLTNPRNYGTERTFDVVGNLRQVTDPSPGGTTTYGYAYLATGELVTTITDPAGNVNKTVTNLRGFTTQTEDRDLGTWNYQYDSLGELTRQTDAKGQQINFGAYDALGRPTTRVDWNSEGTTTWTWGLPVHNTSTEKYLGRLKSVSYTGYTETYTLDVHGRRTRTRINSDAQYDIDMTYSSTTGLLDTLTYPQSVGALPLKLQYTYQNGLPTRISDFNASTMVFWQLNAVNARGQVTDQQMGATGYAGKVWTQTTFHPTTGLASAIQSGTGGSATNRQNLGYLWDGNGNLERRSDLNQGTLYESFVYDSLDRLDYSTRNGTTNLDLTYNAVGNITNKSDVGAYTYPTPGATSVRPHAVSNAGGTSYGYDANGNMNSRGGNAIVWNSANLPTSISGSSGAVSVFSYGPDRQRWRQQATFSGGGTETTIYIGGLMEKVTNGTGTYYRHYIAAGDGTVIHTRSASSTENYFIATDHLGSFNTITNSAGNLVVNESFNAFGERRLADWTANAPASMQPFADVTRRGYTGHEHLDNLGLTHMNGRVQDPRLGRFLSADPIVQAPNNSQSFNRYSYVMNNPLTMTDPSGFQAGGECSVATQNDHCLHPIPTICGRAIGGCEIIMISGRYVDAGKQSAEFRRPDANGNMATYRYEEWDDGYGWSEIWVGGALLSWTDTLGNFGLNSLSFGVGPNGGPMIDHILTIGELVQGDWDAGNLFVRDTVIMIGIGEIAGPFAASALRWASPGLRAFGRFFYDNRNFRTISREHWGGAANGRSLDHWLIPQSATRIPQGIRNAGFNLLELPGLQGVFHRSLGLNQWMGFATRWGGTRAVAAYSMRGAVTMAPFAAGGVAGYGGYITGDWLYGQWEDDE
jgi:RHS repeat-associated protein